MFTLKFRRAYSWRWSNENPTLADGEPGFEINTGRFKLGDGHTAWADLGYFNPEDPTDASNATLSAHVLSPLPHPVYDDGPSLELLYENAKV